MLRVIRQMLVLVFLTAVGAAAAGVWYYSRSDELLRTEILKLAQQRFPNAHVTLERASVDLTGRVWLSQFRVKLPNESRPALVIPEMVLHLDRTALIEQQRLLIHQVRLSQPALRLTRDLAGRWNWSQLKYQPGRDAPTLPDLELQSGHVTIETPATSAGLSALPADSSLPAANESALSAPSSPTMQPSWATITLTDLTTVLTPTSARSLAGQAQFRNSEWGSVSLRGETAIDGNGPWSLDVSLPQVRIDSAWLQSLEPWLPNWKQHCQPWAAHVQRLLEQHRMLGDYADDRLTEPLTVESLLSAVTVTAATRLQLRHQPSAGSPQWRLQARLSDGKLNHRLFPVPLSDIQADVTVDGDRLLIQRVQAEHGDSRLTGNFDRTRGQQWALSLSAEKFPLTDPLIQRLPSGLRRIVQSLALSGLVSGRVDMHQSVHGPLTHTLSAQMSQGTARYDRFPYPVSDITGQLTWRDQIVEIEAQGLARGVPAHLTGTIQRPGPAASAQLFIRSDHLVVDETFRQACPAPLAQTLTSLRLEGMGDVRVRLTRAAGEGQRYVPEVSARLTTGRMNFVGFPYPLTELQGYVWWSGERVRLHDWKALHEGTVIECAEALWQKPAEQPGRLDLPLKVTNGLCDRALYAAVPQSLKSVWDQLGLQGEFDLEAQMHWTPGQVPNIIIPRFSLSKGALLIRDFPWPLTNVSGEFAYEDELLTIQQFQGQHQDTLVGGSGRTRCGVPWQVEFDRLHVDDLEVTSQLRRALPALLRSAIDTLNPTGRFSTDGPVVITGPRSATEPLTASWKQDVVLAGCGLNAGLRLDDLRGRIRLDGNWDGQYVDLTSRVDIDSLRLLGDHVITQVAGPLRLYRGELRVGEAVLRGVVGESFIEPVGASGVDRLLAANDAALTAVTGPRQNDPSSDPEDDRPDTSSPTDNRSPANNQSDEPRRNRLNHRLSGQAYGGEVRLDAFVELLTEPRYQAQLQLIGANLEGYARRHLPGQSNVRGLMNGWFDLRGRGTAARDLEGEGQLQISPAAMYELPVFLQIFQLPQLAPINRTAFNYANFFFTVADARYQFQSIDLIGNTVSLRGRGTVGFDTMVDLSFFTMQPRNNVRLPVFREIAGVVGMATQGWLAIEVRGPLRAPVARVVPFPALDGALQQFLEVLDGRALRPPPLRTPVPRPARAVGEPDRASVP
jgi:hypothetical protein